MINHKQAEELVNIHIQSPTLKYHIREVEVLMRAVAEELKENVEDWGVIGLVHDLDFDRPVIDPKTHTEDSVKWLKETDSSFPEEYLKAIRSHNCENTGVPRDTKLDFALAACDNLSGMIFATTLVYPDKKISSVKVSSVLKKMKNPSFAAKVNRQSIHDIAQAGITLERFVEIGLKAMSEIETELGL
jgi:uncharacterized protein